MKNIKINKCFLSLLLAGMFFMSSATPVIWADGDDDDDRGHKKSWLSSWIDDDDDDDDDDHDERRRKPGKNAKKTAPVLASISAAPPEFESECGSCHMAYQPELLNTVSWAELMSGLENHFGEDASLEPRTHQKILEHLNRFSAEKSDSRLARKIRRSTGGNVYLRISDIPKLKHEHEEEFSASLLKRKSIRSIANCAACHIPAPQGEYDEDYVRIPR